MSAISQREFMPGWRGVCLVAITYIYFLIFAQFAFLNRLGRLGIADAHLKLVMAAMAIGGIGFSLLQSLAALQPWARLRLMLSFFACGAAAFATLLPLPLPAALAVSLLIGAGLGTLTVTLVSNLSLWIGNGNALWKIGLGTGLGYFVCNMPPLFTAGPDAQALTAGLLCVMGIFIAAETAPVLGNGSQPMREHSFLLVLVSFTALVWLDSAAFFIIQNTPALKAGTWEGTLHLWANGVLHLVTALASAYLLLRRGLTAVLASAVLALAIACLLLHHPGQVLLASLFYPLGVSLYSVALVAYPSLLAPSMSLRQRTFRAGLIYAVAGWFGSAMGIGMGQHLRQVPIAFVTLAAALILIPAFFQTVRERWREASLFAGVMAIAFGMHLAVSASPQPARSAIERGRQVYIAEGCINCHSQYVRPNSPDVLIWGPTEPLVELRAEHPPLIGNRRQGPDLSQVGGRRSPLWLKAHFFNPREVSHASFMPSYAHLFQSSGRGEDLVQYLSSLKSPRYAEHLALEQSWQPSAAALATASADDGAHRYGQFCSTCHESTGATRRTWYSQFKRLPPDLHTGPWLHVSGSWNGHDRTMRLAQIIKFGIPGTDMPGHEYLSDNDIASIAVWFSQTMAPPQQVKRLQQQSGESQ